MDVRAAMFFGGDWRARYCEALDGSAGACGWRLPAGATRATPPGPIGHGFAGGKESRKSQLQRRLMAFTSSGASVCGWRERSIRKNIIGHGMSVFPERFSSGNLLLRLLRAFPLLHQPARQHGRGTFFNPKVEKRADFLAEIGGVIEPREFKALQRIVRSGEKKLPRGLGLVAVHAGLLVAEARMLTLHYSWSMVPMAQQSVEKCAKRRERDCGAAGRSALHRGVYLMNGAAATGKMRACSACAGDYEDPDRTAWTPSDGEEEEGSGDTLTTTEEFPAEE